MTCFEVEEYRSRQCRKRLRLAIHHAARKGRRRVRTCREGCCRSSSCAHLVHLDEHTGLVVGVSEDLRLLARDSCVALDKDGCLPAISLHADGERGTSSRRSWVFSDASSLRMAAPKATVSSELIDLFRSVATEEVTDELLDARNVSRAADEDNFVHSPCRSSSP